MQLRLTSSLPYVFTLLGGLLLGIGATIWLSPKVSGPSSLPVQSPLGQGKATPVRASQGSPVSSFVIGFGYVDVEGGTTPLAVPAVGQVQEILVKEGQRVQPDDPMIRLDDRAGVALLNRAKAAVEKAQIQLQQAKRGPDKYRLDLGRQEQAVAAAQALVDAQQQKLIRMNRLQDGSLVSKEEVKAAQHQLKALQSSLQAEQFQLEQLRLLDPQEEVELAEAGLLDAHGQLDLATTHLANHTLKAAQAGTVLRINVKLGQTLTSRQTEPPIWFAAARPRVIRCEVSQRYASKVLTGMDVDLFDDFDDSQIGTGTVQRIGTWIAHRRSLLDEPLERNDVRTFECIIKPHSSDGIYQIGRRVRVVFRSLDAMPGPGPITSR